MPLMGSLYVGQSGLQTSQNALNTTAHNMSNLDTTGYTRQQILLGDRNYNTITRSASAVSNQQIGLGVAYSKVRQVRDTFLDQTYRRESGRSAFYETSYTAMTQMETVLGELYGATFSDSMVDLQEAIAELAKTPSDAVVQGLLVQRASAFLDSAQAVYQGISDYQNNLNLQVKSMVNKINGYGEKIRELNGKILKVESAGVESANDLRDARNQMLDELGQLVNMNYKTDTFGNVTVQIEGHDFVTRDSVYEMGVQKDATTGFYTAFWIVDADYTVNSQGKKVYDTEGAEVFDLTHEISSDRNTDIGSLKAILLARGDKRANYTDLEDADYYNKNIAQSICMNLQAEFDQLIHEMVTKINGVLASAADTSSGYLCTEVTVKGVKTYQPIQLFEKKTTEGYEWGDYTDAEGVARTGWYLVDEDPSRTETLYNTSNLVINADLLKQPTKLGFVILDGSDAGKDDYKTAAALEALFADENLSLNPNVTSKSGFADYYANLTNQVANSGSVYREISESQQETVESTCAAREQIVGVSSDEELSNMIRFQNAYNAASRYINVVSEMLEHILTSLG